MNNHLYRKKTVKRINDKLKLINSKHSALFILNIRLLLSLVILILVVSFFDVGIILGPLLAIIFYYYFEYLFLDLKILKKKRSLEKEAINFFEIILLKLEKENLLQALSNISNNMETEISLEFRQVVKEVEMGKDLNSSLNSLKQRIPSREIKMLISSLQNSNKETLKKELKEQLEVLKGKNELQENYNISFIPLKTNLITIFFIIISVLLIIYQLSILNSL